MNEDLRIYPPPNFWAKFEKTDGCWNWLGPLNNAGYGSFYTTELGVLGAHRYAYLAMIGPIEAGLEIDHLCRNTSCVNPEHLEAVTSRVNCHRSKSPCAENAAKTHCIHGHPFDEENTWIDKGWRRCRICNRERMTRRRRAREAARG